MNRTDYFPEIIGSIFSWIPNESMMFTGPVLQDFRIAPLRNIARTAPYFHDGSAKTLRDAIQIMGEKRLSKKLSEDELTQIEAFLKTLNGELPILRIPILPES